MTNNKIKIIGDVKLVEGSDGDILSSIEIDGVNFTLHTQDVSEGLEFIMKTLMEHCSDCIIKEKGNSKRKSYRLSMRVTDDGYFEIIATARKSMFSLIVRKEEDVVKVLEAVDLRFPRRQLSEFVGESARKALHTITNSDM